MSASTIGWLVAILAVLGSIIGFGIAGRRAGRTSEALQDAKRDLDAVAQAREAENQVARMSPADRHSKLYHEWSTVPGDETDPR